MLRICSWFESLVRKHIQRFRQIHIRFGLPRKAATPANTVPPRSSSPQTTALALRIGSYKLQPLLREMNANLRNEWCA